MGRPVYCRTAAHSPDEGPTSDAGGNVQAGRNVPHLQWVLGNSTLVFMAMTSVKAAASGFRQHRCMSRNALCAAQVCTGPDLSPRVGFCASCTLLLYHSISLCQAI